MQGGKNLASFNLGMRDALVLGDRDFLQKLKSDSVHDMNKYKSSYLYSFCKANLDN